MEIGFRENRSENNESYYANNQRVPDLLTEEELIHFLRIPEVSTATDYSNVINNLVRMRDLPRIQMCNKRLYPKVAILEWVAKETIRE